MKKYFILAVAALAMVACQKSEKNDNLLSQQPNDGSILFRGFTAQLTKGNHVGADAAGLLNGEFVVEGSKGSTSPKEVFDDYLVQWGYNTAGTTQSNTSDWEYVGITAVAPSSIAGNKQTIKYWDYSVDQYDFVAYSLGTAERTTSTPAAGEVKVSAIDYNNLSTAAYTLEGAAADLSKVYIADLVTAYKAGADMNPEQPTYQKEVRFTFRNLAAKARIALYETIPGYSVKNVKFYTDATTTIATGASESNATLYTTGTDVFNTEGTYKVYFPTIGSANIDESDYNKAHVSFTPATSGTATTVEYGALNYTTKQASEKTTGDIWLGRTSSTASFAGTSPYWVTVLPNEAGVVLELRVDYTLESIDGSGEEIKVYGAKALVPAIYAAWKSNYAYTYIFKISDNTNGWTSQVATDPQGLYPITFDAVVADAVEGAEQTTITTVATPAITTYQEGHLYTDGNEYKASKGDIYVHVSGAADLDTKGQLYTLAATATEAEVMSALNLRALDETADVEGRNGVKMTEASSDASITAIPGVDGNDIVVAAKSAASFTPAAGTYAYVYTVTAPTSSEVITSAVTVPSGTDLGTDTYYEDMECTIAASGTTTEDGVYYQKYTKNNGVYAVKVITVL